MTATTRNPRPALVALAGALALSACKSTCSTPGDGGSNAPILIGTPCTDNTQCGGNPKATCNVEAEGFPGGYCSMEDCTSATSCPAGATCISLGGETPACFKSCTADTECRQADGYVCQMFLATPPNGFGPSDHACARPCTRDFDCVMPLKCDVPAGKCHK